MKKNEVELGKAYFAKVSDKVVTVRLDQVNTHGGWDATNLVTNKKVRIKSAQRLRGPANRTGKPKPAADPVATWITTPDAEQPANVAAHDAPATPDAVVTQPKPVVQPVPTTAKKMSGLDACAMVLKERGVSMRCADLVKEVLDRGLWASNAPTPVATLNAAIHREIKVKGLESRFAQTERGVFVFNK